MNFQILLKKENYTVFVFSVQFADSAVNPDILLDVLNTHVQLALERHLQIGTHSAAEQQHKQLTNAPHMGLNP